MTVPFLDLKGINDRDQAALTTAFADVLESGHYIGGTHVKAFETAFARYSEAKHCVSVGNGLDALILILRAAGIGAGDEVIVPANTFIASFLAISAVGATPVPVDVDPETLLLTADAVAAALTDKSRAVMPVHLFGHVCDLGAIRTLAHDNGLLLIEDAAQAHGARDAEGHVVGSAGDAAGFSFYPGKNLGALGDGGAIVTGNDALAEQLACLRNYGAQVKYEHEMKGVNSRLDELQAAILSVRLKRLEDDNCKRRDVAGSYLEGICSPAVRLPRIVAGTTSVWHLFVVRVADRAGFMQHLLDRSVQTLIHYPIPCHKQACYRELAQINCPESEQAAREIVSLPISPVMTTEQVAQVIDAVNAWQG